MEMRGRGRREGKREGRDAKLLEFWKGGKTHLLFLPLSPPPPPPPSLHTFLLPSIFPSLMRGDTNEKEGGPEGGKETEKREGNRKTCLRDFRTQRREEGGRRRERKGKEEEV